MVSSAVAESGPRKSSGTFRIAVGRRRGASKMPTERSVPLTVKRPAAKAISSSAVSSRCAAIFLPFSMTASAALPMTMPASRIERAECEPPPSLTISVSLSMTLTSSNGTPSHSATHCAKVVSWLCPLESVPTTTSTLPSRLHGNVGAFARIAAGGFEVTAQPDAAQPLALLRLGAALLESSPIAELHGAVHHGAIGAVVVGDALRILCKERPTAE